MRWITPIEIKPFEGLVTYSAIKGCRRIERNTVLVRVQDRLVFTLRRGLPIQYPAFILPRHLPGETIDGKEFIPWQDKKNFDSVKSNSIYELLIKRGNGHTILTRCKLKYLDGISKPLWFSCSNRHIPTDSIIAWVEMKLPGGCNWGWV